MRRLALALLIAAPAEVVPNNSAPGWDGDRGRHLGQDGRWHRGWGDADRLFLPSGSRDVDATSEAGRFRSSVAEADALPLRLTLLLGD